MKPAPILRLTVMSLLLVSPLHAEDQSARPSVASQVVVKPISSSGVTSSGQPIVLPRGHLQVTTSTYDIAPGAVLPVHKHPFPRFAYVLEGNLSVTDQDTGQTFLYKPGDMIVEVVNQWHYGENIGSSPVRLLVIDEVEGNAPNTILK